MKTHAQIDTCNIEVVATVAPAVSICMYVLGVARTDVRVMREATALSEAGYAVSIVDIEGEKKQPIEEELSGIRLKHVIMSHAFLSTRFSRWSLIRAAQVLLRSTLRLIQTPTDIYHAHDVSGLLPCSIASRVRRKPLVFDSHELPLCDMSIRSRWLLALLSLLLAHIIPRCAGVITVSPPIAQDIRKHYRLSEVSLIRNIPPYRDVPKSDHVRQHLGLGAETRIVLFQGEIHANRSLDKLIRVAPFLDPDIVIVLMGPGEKAIHAELEAIIDSEGTHNRVKILPPVPYKELLEWTTSADIGVIMYPPNSSLNFHWCLPNKLFEYLMAGLPVLSSQLKAVAELIHTYDVGCVIDAFTPTAIASSINAMLADPVALATMRENALRAARSELLWEREGQKLVHLYHQILSRS